MFERARASAESAFSLGGAVQDWTDPTAGDATRSTGTRQSLVSVVVIFLNAARTLAAAIDSVRMQTHPHWELLLVDDGSTDASARIAGEYAALDPQRIRCLAHPGGENRGMSASRNLGIAHSAGDFLAFLDADDLWLPRKLERQLALMSSSPQADVVVASSLEWHDAADHAPGTALPADRRRRLQLAPGLAYAGTDLLLSIARGQSQSPGICSLLVRRDAIERCGGFEPAFRGMFEDQVFITKLLLDAHVLVDGALGDLYRQHPGSACAQAQRDGSYHPLAANPAQSVFEHWRGRYLAEQLGAAPQRAEAAAQVLRALSADESRAGTPGTAAARGPRLRRRLRRRLSGALLRLGSPPAEPGPVDFGTLRRLQPVSRVFGYDRGTPIDRYYIEAFLAEHAHRVQGRVLEIGDASYTRRFGGARVTRAEVLHVHAQNPAATFVGDLAGANDLPSDAFDCVVLTQTLQLVYDVGAAIDTLHRVLKPGGVVLCTVPGVTQVSTDEWSRDWCWSFTPRAITRLFGERFGADAVSTACFGNVLAATCMLQGICAEELTETELDVMDACYPVTVTVVATRR